MATFLTRSLAITIFIVFSLSAQAQDDIVKAVKTLVQKERKDEEDLFLLFKQYGKEAIPYLINAIDTTEKGFVGFGVPKSSTLRNEHYNFKGIRAAYMIEYILKDTNSIKIFPYGIIVKKGDKRHRQLAIEDMKQVKAYYLSWWEKSQEEPPRSVNQ